MTKTWAIAGLILIFLASPMPVCGGVTHAKVIAQSTASSGASMTFTLQAQNSNDAIVAAVTCTSGSQPTAVSITASGWTGSNAFTQKVTIFGGANNWTAGFVAIAPNTTSVTATVTWTVSGSSCGGFMNVLADDFTGNDSTGGSTTFDASNSGTASGCSLSVTPANSNDAIWFACNDNVTALGSGWSAGANDGSGDRAEYKILSGGSGVAQSDSFTGSGTTSVLGITIKAGSSTTNNNASISETLSNSDSISRGVGRSPITESLSLSESITRGVGRVPMAESLTFSDLINRALVGSVSDTLSHSDLIAEMNARSRGATETVSSSDSTAKGAGHKMSESLAISESLQGNHASIIVTENLSPSDAMGEVTSHARTSVDTLSPSDNIANQENYVRASSDSLSHSDSVEADKAHGMAENRSGSDSLAQSTAHAVSLSEGSANSDSIGTSIPRSRSATETLSASDSIAESTSHKRAAIESSTLTESASEKMAASRSATETLTFNDAILKGLVENLAHSDSMRLQAAKWTQESLVLAESVAITVGRHKKKVVIIW